MIATFTFPNRIRFGFGAAGELADELSRLGVRRPLVVTDRGLKAAGIVDRVLEPLGGPPTFEDVDSNPTEQNVVEAVARYRSEGCDGFVGLGGGSAIDAAKAARLLTTHSGSLADYDLTQGGAERITADLPPMVAIPTTAGTGSEAARGALIQVPGVARKLIVLSPRLLPSVALCDPELTLSLPPNLTAATGMDALTHCVESYLSTTPHPICDGIALEGLRWVAQGLEPSVENGQDRDARQALMTGALLGGISFHKGLGVVHSISHALGSTGRVHHGTLNAILLPHALTFNLEAARPRLIELAKRLGLGRAGNGPAHFIVLTEILLARLPIPDRLGALEGLDAARIPEYARLAMKDHCHRTNPRPCDQAAMEALIRAAW